MAELERTTVSPHPFPVPGERSYFLTRSRPRRYSGVPGPALSLDTTPLGYRDAACCLCRAAGGAVSVWPSQTGSRFSSRSTHTECHYPWSSRTPSGLKILERLPQARREPEGRAPGGVWCTPPAKPGFVLYWTLLFCDIASLRSVSTDLLTPAAGILCPAWKIV